MADWHYLLVRIQQSRRDELFLSFFLSFFYYYDQVETHIPSCVYERGMQAYFESCQSSVQDGSESVNSRENNPPNIDDGILDDDAILAADVVGLLFHPVSVF